MKTTRLAVLAGLFVAVASYAQESGPPPPPDGPPPSGGPPHGMMLGPGVMGFGNFGMHPWTVVKGAPYSATATDQFLQTLAGGNTIQRTTTAQIARDSQGRTYTQRTMTDGPWAAEGGSKTVVFIFDPVAGYSYVLHPDKKVAIRRPIRTPSGRSASGPNFEGRPHRGPGSDKNMTETDLGSKDISGVGAAQGKSINHTIPAGEIGNSQPIVSTSEIWYSRDLQIVVSSKRNDPRTGESTYMLSNMQRSEPKPSLFQVPSDYTIRDASSAHKHPGPPE
jgi:hypothetical protein